MPKNYVPSTSRLKGYANPMKGPAGESRDIRDLDVWSARASANSELAPRASDGPMKLPSTGKAMKLRDTASAPTKTRKADAAVSGKRSSPDVRQTALADTNDYGSSYMKGIKREA